MASETTRIPRRGGWLPVPRSVAARLSLLVGGFVVLVLAALVITAMESRRHRDGLDETLLDFDATISIQQASGLWLAENALVFQYIDTQAPDLPAAISDTRADKAAAFESASVAEADKGELDDVAEIAEVTEQVAVVERQLDQVIAAVDAGDIDGARDLMVTASAGVTPLREQLTEMVDEERTEIGRSSVIAADSAESALRFQIIAAVMVLGLAVLATVLVIRGIIRPLGALRRAADQIARGDYATAPIAGPSDVQTVHHSLRTMADRVGEREEELRESEARWRSLILNGHDIITVVDNQSMIRYASPSIETVLGWKPDEVIGMNALAFLHRDDLDETATTLASATEAGPGAVFEYRIRLKDGTWSWLEGLVTPVEWDGEEMVVVNSRDITERRAASERIAHMAFHDALTNLPNRLLLQDRFEVALAQARRAQRTVCVLSIDLDRFKIINDTLGHAAGDQLLNDAAARLSHIVRDGDTVARVGGDEFEVLLADCDSEDDATQVAGRIVESFRRPFNIHGKACHTTASIGISVYGKDGLEPEELLQKADVAMYASKAAGRDGFRLYHPEMQEDGEDWLAIESDLRVAIEEDEIEVHYQPQVSLSTGEVVGVEALARWQHPRRGMVSPVQFIPVAEETGVISAIGGAVLRKACQDAVSWDKSGMAPIRLSVNISYRQIQDATFMDTVRSILQETSFDPRRLQLEITESTALKDLSLTRTVAEDLAALGVSLSIDDFGAGSTSLRYLKEFPINELKIDRGFIRDLSKNPDNAAIATSVIALGHELNLNVIAEGVETPEQLTFLQERGCDEFQGFLHSKPMPANELRAMMKAHAATTTP